MYEGTYTNIVIFLLRSCHINYKNYFWAYNKFIVYVCVHKLEINEIPELI